ncbi:MAG: FUSC family protein [Chitinophagaceae bacterium]|nr:FUSC family protein [Chitinophagaceae bacterium]
MDQIKSYKSFIYSYYLYEGVRMTAGILVPAVVMSYFNLLPAGITISLGAVGISVIDTPGPIHHRNNAMLAGIGALFLVALITGLAMHSPVTLAILLFLLCFLFSMLAVYGARAGAIGIAALLIMILNLSQPKQGWQIVENALLITAGGIWYLLFSLALYRLRPYKLAQQALGDYIQNIAGYLRVRASFYEENTSYDENYSKLIQTQSEVQESQNLVTDLLFKTRSIVKESTHTGRTLVMIYLDATDLFESIMTSYQGYRTLHDYFGKTTILKEFHALIDDLCEELEEIGIAVKSGSRSHRNNSLMPHIKEERERYGAFRKKYLNPENIDGFIALRRILDNIQDIAERLYTLHRYTRSGHNLRRKSQQQMDLSQLVLHQEVNPKMLLDNLTLRSNIFRHSLRVSISILAGYLISLAFPLGGHGYWILLTILVILKPAYSLTKKRNADRLIGTFIGILAGVLILYTVKNETALLAIMITFMTICYIFIRQNYLIGVVFMTPYVLLFLHLLYPTDSQTVLTDRMLDTLIGSVIAFIASSLLIPSWERETIRSFMISMLKDVSGYFSSVTAGTNRETQEITLNEYGIARKDALVSLANLSDAFNRMLSEPKSQQKDKEQIHQFVALNHQLISHIATLAYYVRRKMVDYSSAHYKAVALDILQHISTTIAILDGSYPLAAPGSTREAIRLLNGDMNVMLEKRKAELKQGLLETETKKGLLEMKSLVDQFNFISNIVIDLQKVSSKIHVR